MDSTVIAQRRVPSQLCVQNISLAAANDGAYANDSASKWFHRLDTVAGVILLNSVRYSALVCNPYRT